MFAVMIGNDLSDTMRIQRTISLLENIINMAFVDKGKLSGLGHDIPDVEDLLLWFKDLNSIINSAQYTTVEA